MVRILVVARDFSPKTSRPAMRPIRPGGVLEVKRPEYAINHSFPSSADVNYEWNYVVCPKSKCTDFLFKCLLDSPQITSYLLQSKTLGKLHSGSNVFSTDHSSTGSHFP